VSLGLGEGCCCTLTLPGPLCPVLCTPNPHPPSLPLSPQCLCVTLQPLIPLFTPKNPFCPSASLCHTPAPHRSLSVSLCPPFYSYRPLLPLSCPPPPLSPFSHLPSAQGPFMLILPVLFRCYPAARAVLSPQVRAPMWYFRDEGWGRGWGGVKGGERVAQEWTGRTDRGGIRLKKSDWRRMCPRPKMPPPQTWNPTDIRNLEYQGGSERSSESTRRGLGEARRGLRSRHSLLAGLFPAVGNALPGRCQSRTLLLLIGSRLFSPPYVPPLRAASANQNAAGAWPQPPFPATYWLPQRGGASPRVIVGVMALPGAAALLLLLLLSGAAAGCGYQTGLGHWDCPGTGELGGHRSGLKERELGAVGWAGDAEETGTSGHWFCNRFRSSTATTGRRRGGSRGVPGHPGGCRGPSPVQAPPNPPQSCPPTRPDMLNVHLVPHSHDDTSITMGVRGDTGGGGDVPRASVGEGWGGPEGGGEGGGGRDPNGPCGHPLSLWLCHVALCACPRCPLWGPASSRSPPGYFPCHQDATVSLVPSVPTGPGFQGDPVPPVPPQCGTGTSTRGWPPNLHGALSTPRWPAGPGHAQAGQGAGAGGYGALGDTGKDMGGTGRSTGGHWEEH
ncbi:hypothetical protein DV515_00017681, partial [Chloebia gouldiae]